MKEIPHVMQSIMNKAIKNEATDIHFYVSETVVNVYFRINGLRFLNQEISVKQYTVLLVHLKFTASMDIGESLKPQDGSLEYDLNNRLYSLRLSTLPMVNMESLTIRILPQTEKYKLEELLLFKYQVKAIKRLSRLNSGLIIMSGPTGSGKTTLMYSMIEDLLKEKKLQIITLEDPVERNIDEVIQIQINEQAKISYETGLKAILRHDPDVILVGEIRDAKTAEYAFRAALTGHLVLTTVHASNLQGTIERLKELGISNIEIKQSLKSIISIKLVLLKEIKKVKRRAAITEMTENYNWIENKTKRDYLTFSDLRKKAYAYGFIEADELYVT